MKEFSFTEYFHYQNASLLSLYLCVSAFPTTIPRSLSVPASPKQRPLFSGKWDVRIATSNNQHPSLFPQQCNAMNRLTVSKAAERTVNPDLSDHHLIVIIPVYDVYDDDAGLHKNAFFWVTRIRRE